jgi:hypothetical protein
MLNELDFIAHRKGRLGAVTFVRLQFVLPGRTNWTFSNKTCSNIGHIRTKNTGLQIVRISFIRLVTPVCKFFSIFGQSCFYVCRKKGNEPTIA